MNKAEMAEIRHAGKQEWDRRWFNPLSGDIELPHEILVDYAEKYNVRIEDLRIKNGKILIKGREG
jgi:hypothetical protein